MNFRRPFTPAQPQASPPVQQEMVQTDRSGYLAVQPPYDTERNTAYDRHSTASPLWRTASANAQRPLTPERERKVIGASYSHADNLTFNTRSATSESRPHTPPSIPRGKSALSPQQFRASISPPPRRTNSSFLADPSNAWTAEQNDIDGDDDDEALGYVSNEDEFGLPSIADMRRKGRRLASRKVKDPGGTSSLSYRNGNPIARASSHAPNPSSWALDNGDVAEERAIPTYPSAQQTSGKNLRPQYKDILRDPANSLHLISHPPAPVDASAKDLDAHATRISRINKFKKILQASAIDLRALRDSAWSGLPAEVRAMSWQLLLGYLPTSSERRVTVLERKRKEYLDGVRQAFQQSTATTTDNGQTNSASPSSPARSGHRRLDEAIWHQISIDVPRTNPHLPLYSHATTQRSLERILYLWSIRHPASGYVQGISDLATPFFQVFLAQYLTSVDIESGMDPGQLPRPVLDAVEADAFWCLTKLLDGIQDNYIHAQPGIVRQVSQLRDLTARIDEPLAKHMEAQGVEFMQFSFRWMNCLLMREVSVGNTVRMWDTYLAEDQGFTTFHLYVCAAFLVKWSDQLLRMDFQETMMFLQALPTQHWTDKDVELLLSEAFIWKSLFAGSKAHVKRLSGGAGLEGA